MKMELFCMWILNENASLDMEKRTSHSQKLGGKLSQEMMLWFLRLQLQKALQKLFALEDLF